MGYTGLAIKNVSWVSAFRFASRGLAFVRMAILARILSPTQFGDYGVATLVLALVEMLTETGINVFLIQHKDEEATSEYLDTAYYISIIRGLVIGLLVAISALPIGKFYSSKAAIWLILATSLIPIIRGFINPAVANFQKHLKFQTEFYFRTFIAIVDALFAILFAVLIHHPMSLVIGLIAGAITEVILSHKLLPEKPKAEYHPIQAKHILKSGKWVTLAGITAFLSSKLPDGIIGKLMPKADLGYFQMGYRFSVAFIDEFIEMINRVAFPVYSKLNHDLHRLTKAFAKTHLIFSLLGILGMTAIYFASPIMANILLGNKWLSVIPIMKLLCFTGMAIALAAPTNPLFLALKAQKYLSLTIIVQLFGLISTLIYSSSNLSLPVIINAYTLSILVSLIPRVFFTYLLLFSKSTKFSNSPSI